MKRRTAQSNGGYTGQTTYVLDSLSEALGLVLNSKAFKSNNFGNLREQICSVLPNDFIAQAKDVNPHLRIDMASFGKYWKDSNSDSFMQCVKDIQAQSIPGQPNLMEEAKKYTDILRDMVLDVEPSLRLDQSWQQVEQSDVFDAGAIASGEDRPCFQKNKEEQRTKSGKGDGAFRILCNTDVYFGGNPCFQGAQLAALVDILQGKAPVEIWVQQGWMGSGEQNGVTLFPVHQGGPFELGKALFWICHPGKDSPFSWIVNRVLGRTASGVSSEAEMPCDLYLYNVRMPGIWPNKSTPIEELLKPAIEWVKCTARKMLFEEEDPNNWQDES